MFWTSTQKQDDNDRAFRREVIYYDDRVMRLHDANKQIGFSVRCLKDD
ncbi:MAG TPA: hypothetical protein PKH94_09615 [Bacteroidales bacterium]|nr:hypothetical protein [Bacteroidales bacterium]HNS47485.1 hypothetical protein [Bacteroidales bacterium]